MNPLRQSTAAILKLGPFVDDSDGKTPETALVIAQGDIRLSRNGGDFAPPENAAGAAHDENGYYDVPLDAADINTPGRLRVAVSKAGALPVWADFIVLPPNVYDSLVAGADNLDVDVSSVPTAQQNAAALLSASGITAGGERTVAEILAALNALARGKVVRDGDSYTWFDDDGETAIFTLTVAANERTPV